MDFDFSSMFKYYVELSIAKYFAELIFFVLAPFLLIFINIKVSRINHKLNKLLAQNEETVVQQVDNI